MTGCPMDSGEKRWFMTLMKLIQYEIQVRHAGAGLGSRGLTWAGSRSSFLRHVVKPFFRDCREKWLLASGTAKMVTNGRPRMRFQKAPKLFKEWGEGQGKNFVESKRRAGQDLSMRQHGRE